MEQKVVKVQRFFFKNCLQPKKMQKVSEPIDGVGCFGSCTNLLGQEVICGWM